MIRAKEEEVLNDEEASDATVTHHNHNLRLPSHLSYRATSTNKVGKQDGEGHLRFLAEEDVSSQPGRLKKNTV